MIVPDRTSIKKALLALSQVGRVATAELKSRNSIVARGFVGTLSKYPPKTPGNAPPPPGWKRGVGMMAKSGKIVRQSGKIGGAGAAVPVGWKISVSSAPNSTIARISTNVSYAPWVVSAKQAAFHRSNGWKNIGMVMKEFGLAGEEISTVNGKAQGALHFTQVAESIRSFLESNI